MVIDLFPHSLLQHSRGTYSVLLVEVDVLVVGSLLFVEGVVPATKHLVTTLVEPVTTHQLAAYTYSCAATPHNNTP